MPLVRVALSVVLLLSVSLSHADAPLSTEASQAHYDAGRTYFQAGDPRRAIVEFRAGQRDDDRPAFDYNLAVCYDKIGDAVRAIAAYRRYLERSPNDPLRREIETKIAALEPHVGIVKIVSRTPSPQLKLDGEVVVLADDGTLRVTAGTHLVAASKDGYLARSTELVVTGGSTTSVELTLEIAGAGEHRRRRNLAIGLGVAGGVVVVGLAVGLGVGLTRPPAPYGGNVAPIVVHP